jgi:hypothetical protein
MRVAVAGGSLSIDTLWTQTKDGAARALLRIFSRVSRRPAESFEVIIARAIDDAFAEFAKEMAG